MANPTKCLTPETRFHTEIYGNKVLVSVDLPFKLDIDEEEGEVLETLLHNQIELVLRPYFYKDKDK